MTTNEMDSQRALAGYAELISRFVDGRISAQEFESSYLRMFKNEKTRFPVDVFDLLDGLFADVDEYVADPDLRNDAGGLDDEQLRTRARTAYDRLRSIRDNLD